MHQSILHFPNIQLQARDGHKLRGYFAQLFGRDSDLWHNHQSDGKVIYRYPLIQYKVIAGAPMLVGIEAGAQLLIQRFLNIDQMEINGQQIQVQEKNLQSHDLAVGVQKSLFDYRFVHPWIALNQKNFPQYNVLPVPERKNYLEKILQNNILAFYKGIQHFETQRIMVKIHRFTTTPVQFKNEKMLGVYGQFTSNALVPDYIGLGKSVSRGFGTIIKNK